MIRISRAAAVVATLAVTSAAGVSAAAPASATQVGPSVQRSAAHCDPWQVVSADWLKVHTSPSAKSSAVGQLPRLANFEACSYKVVGKVVWLHGSGYNGSKKLTGWVDSNYMASY